MDDDLARRFDREDPCRVLSWCGNDRTRAA
jgi:hypothetical protein